MADANYKKVRTIIGRKSVQVFDIRRVEDITDSDEESSLPSCPGDDALESPQRTRPRSIRPMVTKCLTMDVPETIGFRRTGITPYFTKNGENVYYICVDARYGTLTDPGGCICPPEGFLAGGVRELKEESMGIFDYTTLNAMKHIRNNSISIHNGVMIMTFQMIEVPDADKTCKLFRRRYEKAVSGGAATHLVENSYLLWITEPNLCKLAMGNRVPLPESLKLLMKPARVKPARKKVVEVSELEEVVLEDEGPEFYPQLYSRVKTLLSMTFEGSPELLNIP